MGSNSDEAELWWNAWCHTDLGKKLQQYYQLCKDLYKCCVENKAQVDNPADSSDHPVTLQIKIALAY